MYCCNHHHYAQRRQQQKLICRSVKFAAIAMKLRDYRVDISCAKSARNAGWGVSSPAHFVVNGSAGLGLEMVGI